MRKYGIKDLRGTEQEDKGLTLQRLLLEADFTDEEVEKIIDLPVGGKVVFLGDLTVTREE